MAHVAGDIILTLSVTGLNGDNSNRVGKHGIIIYAARTA